LDCLNDLTNQFWSQTRNGLTLGAIYAMIALGYTMVYGVLQLINFAHSEVFMVSTVAAFYALHSWFGVTEHQTGLILVLILLGALIPAMLASGAAAVTIERLAYRPLRRRGAPRLAFLIAAIGASLTIQYLFVLMDGNHSLLFLKLPAILGPNPHPVPEAIQTQRLFSVFGTPITNKQVTVWVVSIIMLVILDTFVRKTKLGRGIRAVSQDADTAAMMGVNIDRVVVVTFLVGGLMAGAAGFLFVAIFPGAPAFWNIGFIPGIKAFTAAVLGGIGNIRGAMLGGLVLGLVESYGVACTAAQGSSVIAFVVLVVVLMFRPTGILGQQVGA
jgi:branched-chain amino acid transport system permease protein